MRVPNPAAGMMTMTFMMGSAVYTPEPAKYKSQGKRVVVRFDFHRGKTGG
jgi:hypothetical protein